jgi:hypothetical protein
MDRLTPDVFTRRVALIATVAAQWTFENVTSGDAYDGKLPDGAAARFTRRIRSVIDELDALLAEPAAPAQAADGAAEPEPLKWGHPEIEAMERACDGYVANQFSPSLRDPKVRAFKDGWERAYRHYIALAAPRPAAVTEAPEIAAARLAARVIAACHVNEHDVITVHRRDLEQRIKVAALAAREG